MTDPSGGDVVGGFLRAEALGKAISKTRFTLDEEVGMLVGFMRDQDAKVALAAHTAFRRTLGQVANADGIIGKQTLTARDSSGRRMSVSRSVLPLPSETRSEPAVQDFAATYLPAADHDASVRAEGAL